MSSDRWFVDRKGQKLGPYPKLVLRQLAERGVLRPDDLVWIRGLERWMPFNEVPDRYLADTPPVAAREHPIEPPAKKSSNYLLRHWRGELPLPISYWINGFALGLVLWLVLQAFSSAGLGGHFGPMATARQILGFLSFVIAVALWQSVGIWRSASNHVEQGGRSRWAMVAGIAAIIGLIRIGGFAVQELPVVHQAFGLVSGHQAVPLSQIRVLNNATEVEIAGGLSFGTTDNLKAILDKTPTVRIVQLNNAGGWVSEGNRLGELIKKRRLATFTPRECDSACLLAFMGGSTRMIGSMGRLGFHQASVGGVGGKVADAGTQEFRKTLLSNGVPEEFVSRALSTPPSSIWYPTTEELLAAHVITGVVDERAYATTGVVDWQDPASLEADFAKIPIFAALKRAEPAIYENIQDIYVSGIQRGAPQLEMSARARDIMIKQVVPKYLRQGEDTALLAYWQTKLAEVRELRARNARSCVAFMFPTLIGNAGDVSAQLSSDIRNAELQSLIALLDASSVQPEPAASPSAAQDALKEAASNAEKESPGAMKILSNAPQSVRNPAALCDAALDFYGSITDLPVDEAAPVLRYLATKT